MFARPVVLALLAVSTAACFQIDRLDNCSRIDGLYLPYHVCMPPARASLALDVEPRDLIVGDFDGDGQEDDIAVLSDPDVATVYTRLDQDTPVTRELRFTTDGGTVGGIVAAHFFDGGVHGDDLFGWIARPAPAPSEIVALPNGGNLFAAPPIAAILQGYRLTGAGEPLDEDPRPCYAPNGGLALHEPMGPDLNLIIVTCVPDTAGQMVAELTSAELPDAIAIAPDEPFAMAKFGSLVGEDYRRVGAAQLTVFDELTYDVRVVFAHRPGFVDDAEIAIVSTADLDPTTAIAIKPRQGSIDEIRVADLDLDGDLDLLAIHREKAGFSIIRQQPNDGGARVFGEPEFYTLDRELSEIVIGDFTGDGGPDLAVAHNVDNSSLDAITVYALDLQQPGGPVPYKAVQVGQVEGAIVALRTLRFDADERDDLVVAVREGARGYINVYVNLSPGDG
jgi:hypothetical protein